MGTRGDNNGMQGRFGGSIVRSSFFARLQEKAKQYLNDPAKLKQLVDRARTKSKTAGDRGPFKAIWESVMALLRLLRAYWRGDYRQVPVHSLILIVAGLLYFVLPIDIIPDFLLGVGFLDDAAVLTWVISQVRTTLDEFLRWEASTSPEVHSARFEDS